MIPLNKILEGNKLIQEFMEVDAFEYDSWKVNQLTEGLYHSSWDWLMPVISKIMKLGYHVVFEMKSNWDESTFSIYNPECGNELIDPYIAMEDYNPDNLLEYVWFSVVEFIK